MMKQNSIELKISLFLLAQLLWSCFQSDYTKLVKSELAKGVREDSILLGIQFGDTREIFFNKCMELNRHKLATQGPSGLRVQYLFTDSTIHKVPTEIKLLFSPDFDDKNIISEMNLEFSYTGWAPWNRHLQADSLEPKLLKIVNIWYKGNEFIIADIGGSKIPVKLDANRRLMLKKLDEQTVLVKVQDILHPRFRHSISIKKNDNMKTN